MDNFSVLHKIAYFVVIKHPDTISCVRMFFAFLKLKQTFYC